MNAVMVVTKPRKAKINCNTVTLPVAPSPETCVVAESQRLAGIDAVCENFELDRTEEQVDHALTFISRVAISKRFLQ